MNHPFGRWALAMVLGAGLAATPASAQLETTLESLSGEFAQGYLGPLADGMSGSMNSGIFRNGDVPFAGLNLTLDLKAVVVGFSDDHQTYTAEVEDFGSGEVPTVVGSLEPGSLTGPGGATLPFPGGFDLEHFGIAVPQLTVGSVYGTRAIIRYISLSLGDEDDDLGEFSYWGIGGQHSVSRYLPGLPVDVAAGLMYQKFNIGKDDLVTAKALAFNLTGSKKFGMVVSVEPYVGIGVDSFEMDAQYTFDNDGTEEEIALTFDRQNDFHGTIGVSLNVPGVKLHGELNKAAASGYAVGLSFGI
ncbi:MAG: hypothetical protein DHS20C21_14270 [Gemmatimonadota bacterium]|nr:MAG: hypothetical protein DHS20C21_14270 [Gemmatimonadota bacterium]